ncbi:DNA polymerase alpha catalytic subunit [Stylophora pistillata]|uniref:DNA-directed DNA polymerase n=1 Tax=Stylophora pistillata TaxID=50429 RepID=A0A2B4RUX3_STYPI|nr:DNA polymerase alpha catalytic subunit [Stylophora pistillata]
MAKRPKRNEDSTGWKRLRQIAKDCKASPRNDKEKHTRGNNGPRRKDGSSLAASQQAYHPDEFCKSDTLKIDMQYYLAIQAHPVLSPLCDPIDSTDTTHITECLSRSVIDSK